MPKTRKNGLVLLGLCVVYTIEIVSFPITNGDFKHLAGWWCNFSILKNMSSSMGRMTSHIWNGELKPCLKPPTRMFMALFMAWFDPHCHWYIIILFFRCQHFHIVLYLCVWMYMLNVWIYIHLFYPKMCIYFPNMQVCMSVVYACLWDVCDHMTLQI